MRLKVGNTSYGQVDVITPSGNYWIGFYACVATLLKEVEECFPHCVLEGLAPHREAVYRRVADESIRILSSIATGGATAVSGPEACPSNPTGLADVS